MNVSPQQHHLHEPIKEFLLGTTSSPSSAMADTFLQIVPESAHFQVALNILLPTMTDPTSKMESRVQAAFLLWFLYRQHSLDMNPFQVAFQEALQANQTHVTIGQKRDSLSSPKPSSLVLTLEMLLSGRGYQLAPYSPEVLTHRWPFSADNMNVSPRSIQSERSGSSAGPALSDTSSPNGRDSRPKTARELLEDAAERVLSITEQRPLLRAIPSFVFYTSAEPPSLLQSQPNNSNNSNEPNNTTLVPIPFPNLSPIIQMNPSISYQLISRIIQTSSEDSEARDLCFNTLTILGPSLTNYDLWIKLLGDHTPISRSSQPSLSSTASTSTSTRNPSSRPNKTPNAANESETVTVSAALLRYGVFNRFLETCEEAIGLIQREEEAEASLDPDGRFSNLMSSFCRLLTLILSRDDLAGAMNEDERFAVITLARGFGLRYSKFQDGNKLYRFVVGLRA